MFKDYKIISYLRYDHFTDQHECLARIIDDDFETEIPAWIASGSEPVLDPGAAVIKIYSQKQLDVARNLTLFILKINEKYSQFQIGYVIENMEKYVPEFKQYSEQIKQLLLFS